MSFEPGEVNLAKYQEESTKVSMVSVSRRAGPPHFGQATLVKLSIFVNGDCESPLKSTSVGSFTGRSFSGTGTEPHFSQYMIGMGQPQYLCLDMPQSRILKFTD